MTNKFEDTFLFWMVVDGLVQGNITEYVYTLPHLFFSQIGFTTVQAFYLHYIICAFVLVMKYYWTHLQEYISKSLVDDSSYQSYVQSSLTI